MVFHDANPDLRSGCGAGMAELRFRWFCAWGRWVLSKQGGFAGGGEKVPLLRCAWEEFSCSMR